MKLLIVAHRICSRTFKQLVALHSKGIELHIITHTVPKPDIFKTISYYNDVTGLRNSLALYKNIDLVQVVSEPSWVVITCREVLDKKIILDLHDAQIWRSDKPEDSSTEERLVFNWVDGFIVPSQTCKQLLQTNKPCIVLPPYHLEDHIAYVSWGYVGGVVYEGRVDLPNFKEFMKYSKYEDCCKEFREAGIPFTIYSPLYTEEHKKVYGEICMFQPGIEYTQMVKTIGVHDWGLCGNVYKTREWDLAMPNKLFDYLAAGLPVIALNAKTVGRFVEKHKIGISVKSIQEIKDRWDEREECQRNVMLKRNNFTMEKHIEPVIKFYKGVLQGPR